MIVYRDVIPVVGEAVPEGCEWRFGSNLPWEPEIKSVFSSNDRVAYLKDGLQYRCPEPLPETDWLNTLSLD